MKPELGGDSHFSGTTNYARPVGYRSTRIPKIPFTAAELMSMFGLTVEEAEKKGYRISGRKKVKSNGR